MSRTIRHARRDWELRRDWQREHDARLSRAERDAHSNDTRARNRAQRAFAQFARDMSRVIDDDTRE